MFLNHSNKFEILATHFYRSPFDGTKKQSFLSRIIAFKLFFYIFFKIRATENTVNCFVSRLTC